MRFLGAAFFTILATLAMPVAAQQVVVEKDTELRGDASSTAPVVGKVAKGTNGEVTDKKGAWVNLKTTGATGWLFSFNVRFASSAAGGGGDGGAGTMNRLAGPRTNVSVTSTLGTRGLDKETLGNGVFDAEQMQLLDSYATTRDAAQAGATGAGLASASVAYLEAK